MKSDYMRVTLCKVTNNVTIIILYTYLGPRV